MNLPVKMDANNVNMDMIMNMSMYKVCDIFMIMNMQDMYICTYLKKRRLFSEPTGGQDRERTAKNRFFRGALFVSTVSWSSLAEWSGLC
jgi:hypothetical protein